MSVEGVGNIGIAMICVLVALLIPAAIFDLRSRRIPNWLCLVGLVLGLVERWWVTLALTLSARRLTQVPAAEVEAVEIPYAVSIALGAVIAVLVSQLWTV
jgi:Flp pilus assembly protein protease CpaA